MAVSGRADQVRESIDGVCDVLIVTKPANVRWLTGFTGSNGAVAVSGGKLTVATDARYAEQVDEQLDAVSVEATVIIERDVIAALVDSVADDAVVGFESHHLTWAQRERVVDLLNTEDRVRPVDRLIEGRREIKDLGEQARLARAAALADHALASVLAELPGSVTEREIARRLEATMIDLGADDVSFPTIVAGGPNSSRPHAVPSGPPTGDPRSAGHRYGSEGSTATEAT